YNGAQTTINIPAHAWETMGLSAQGKYTLNEIFLYPQTININSSEGIPLSINANSVRIFEIK
ncbi:MAG: hypothetical protein ACK41O_00575, partial [Runella zeae]